MVKISALTCTYKPGFIKQQGESLSRQRFKDFEWILVDDHYDLRKKVVKEYLDSLGLNYKHIPPRIYHDYFDYAGAYNTCILHASGTLLYWMNDYMYPLKNCLERHWELYNKYPNSFFTGLTISYPSLEIPKLGWINIYSPHPNFYLNVFEGEIEPTRTTIYPHYQKLPLKELEHFVYTANIRELGELRLRGFWLGRNDSCSLEAALDLNGVNEAFSGAWGGADVDFHERLEIAYGQKYIIDRNVESLALELPNPWKGAKRSIMDVRERDEIVYKTIRDPLTIAKKQYRSINKLDLKGERNHLETG